MLGLKLKKLQIGIAGGQHGREAGRFFFAPALLAWLLEMTTSAHHLQGALAVDFLFQSPQRFIHWLAFFKIYFSQNSFTSSPTTWESGGRYGRPFRLSQAKMVFFETALSTVKNQA